MKSAIFGMGDSGLLGAVTTTLTRVAGAEVGQHVVIVVVTVVKVVVVVEVVVVVVIVQSKNKELRARNILYLLTTLSHPHDNHLQLDTVYVACGERCDPSEL